MHSVEPDRSVRLQQTLALDLHASHALLLSMLENLPDMIFMKDATTLRFVFMNSAGAKLLGIPQGTFIGKSDFDFFPPDEANFFVERDRYTLAGGVMLDIPVEPIRTSTGETRLLHTKKIPLFDENGRPEFLLGISRDITDEIRMERELTEIATIEQERIAHDLHDSLGQTLTSLALKARLIENDMKSGTPLPPLLMHQVIWLANHASEQARAIARGMDPVVLDKGLIPALKDLVVSTEEAFSVKCRLDVSIPESHVLDKRTASHLYRIVQEAVNNSVRHAKPTNIQVEVRDWNGYLRVRIVDNGSGMSNSSDHPTGSGIRNMKYRARLIGAQLDMANNPQGGTAVTCLMTWPLNQPTGGQP